MTINKLLPITGLALIAGCSGIGDGNGPVSLELQIGGVSEAAEVFACQVASPSVRVRFTNDTVGNFFNQGRDIQYSSSDPDVLAISDGSFPSPDGQFFVPGVLVPLQPGTATITASYLNLTDSIDVTVKAADLELGPFGQSLVQGQSVFLSATGILEGAELLRAADFSNLGQWRVVGADEDTSASTIDANTGLLSAREGAAGKDIVEFEIDFCGVSEQLEVEVVNETLASVRLVAADDPELDLQTIELPPNTSYGVRVIAEYSGGFEQDLTSRAAFSLSEPDVAFVNLRGSGVVSAVDAAAGLSSELTATLDPDSSVEGDEIISAPVTLKVLNVDFVAGSLDITPKDALMLQGTSLQYQATGEFSGADGDLVWDLTKDVLWSSDEPLLAGVQNAAGALGIAVASADQVGPVDVAAQRRFYGAEESLDSGSLQEVGLTVGALSADDPVAVVQGLLIEADEGDFVAGESVTLRAVAQIGPEDQVLDTQDISSGVVWSSSDEQAAIIQNAANVRGRVTVLTEEADKTVRFTARYRDLSRQEGTFTADFDVVLNPSPTPEPTPAPDEQP